MFFSEFQTIAFTGCVYMQFCRTLTMESFLRNLTKQVTCSICLETFKEPKIISCFHTFCCECLEKHARVSQRHEKFRCPECQAEIHLPQGNRFEALPTSFFHNSLLNILAVRQSGDGTNVTCGNCNKTSSNVHYCFDCARFMCPECLNAHEIMRDAFEGLPRSRLRSFVKATALLHQEVPRARDHEILLPPVSMLCLPSLHRHGT